MQIEDQSPFSGRPQVVVVGVALGAEPSHVVDEHLDELENLAAAAGASVVGRVVQRRRSPDAKFFIGGGKAQEVADLARELGAEIVVFDDDLSPSQVRALEKVTDRAVVDRSALILEIFHQRARTREARTQVQLARLRHLLPRLTRHWSHLSRQAGGIGVRGGEGEKQLEADRRILRTRIKKLERELAGIEKTRKVQRRNRRSVQEIALAGYTNAGKSTLFNQLTGDETLVRDQVFATLDARLRRGHLPGGDGARTAVFADTVGFIRKLPHHLVASFRSTLEEVAFADLVLHVVDRSHPQWQDQQAVGADVLRDMEIDESDVLVVHNKVDRLAPAEPPNPGAVRVSAVTGEGLDDLRREIVRRLYGELVPQATPETATATAD